jgi:hypothetical protein
LEKPNVDELGPGRFDEVGQLDDQTQPIKFGYWVGMSMCTDISSEMLCMLAEKFQARTGVSIPLAT